MGRPMGWTVSKTSEYRSIKTKRRRYVQETRFLGTYQALWAGTLVQVVLFH